MQATFRKNEGMILVCQNNEDRTFLIFGINPRGEELTGYRDDSLKGRCLTEIVPKDIRQAIEDYVEFKDEAPDLASVLGKIRDFRLLNAEGDEIPVGLKIAPAEARDKNFWYRLILRDMQYEREVEAFKQTLSDNFKGHEVVDEDTGLPDRASLIKDLEIAHYYATSKGFSSCFAVFRLDQYHELRRVAGGGEKLPVQAIRQMGANLRRNLREDDAAGYLTKDCLGVILVDIPQESTRAVLNRLRWTIAAEPLFVSPTVERRITTSAAFTMLGKHATAEEILTICEDALARDGTPNILIER